MRYTQSKEQYSRKHWADMENLAESLFHMQNLGLKLLERWFDGPQRG